jgi:hypothetical protein
MTARAAETGIAAALHLDRVEIWPIGHMIVGITFASDRIAGFEIDEAVRPSADRLQIRRRVARISPLVALEQVLGDDHAVGASRPERRRLREVNPHGERIDLFDEGGVLIAADRRGRGLRVGRVFPIEHDVLGGERLAVVPFDALLQFPGHRHAVGGDSAIFDIRDLGGEHRHQISVGIPGGQRFIKDARALLVLAAGGKMRIEQGRSLPEQHAQCPAAPGPDRLVCGADRGLG